MMGSLNKCAYRNDPFLPELIVKVALLQILEISAQIFLTQIGVLQAEELLGHVVVLA